MNGHLLLVRNGGPAAFDPAWDLVLQGYAVTTAATLAEARRHLGDGPELVLVDVARLPDLEDWPACHETCRRRHIPCLIFSAAGAADARLGRHAALADAVLLDAADRGELRRRVGDLIRQRRLQLKLLHTRRQLRQRLGEQAAELHSAAEIQQSLLPSQVPSVENLHFAWCFAPAARVGGDLFNVLRLDEDTVMAYLFDVCGHGVAAAMVAVAVHQSLSPQTGRIVKRLAPSGPGYEILPPAAVLAELEREYPFERFEKFFTIAYLLVNHRDGRVRYCSAAHPPAVLLRRDGTVATLPAGGGLIGLGIGGPFAETEVRLEAGDRLYLCSDGLLEQTDPAGTPFGTERLLPLLAASGGAPLATGCDAVFAALRRFAGGRPLQDDTTLLGLEFRGE